VYNVGKKRMKDKEKEKNKMIDKVEEQQGKIKKIEEKTSFALMYIHKALDRANKLNLSDVVATLEMAKEDIMRSQLELSKASLKVWEDNKRGVK
jgi:predicted nuclease with TOPRIM domain